MENGADLPIALRRTRRSLTRPSSSPSAHASTTCTSSAATASVDNESLGLRTPKSRKRRVRFSDPGPQVAESPVGPSSTGLTPMVRRACLSGATGRTQRRRSTPARLSQHANGSGIPEWDADGSPFGGEVRFLPLRQVLDGRVKRRIRRNGLSEEMNAISTERKRHAQEARAEIERLKAELAEKDDEIARLHDETVVLDTDRVWDLEQQVAALKRELASRSGVVQGLPSSPAYEWTRAARDPYSDDFMELDLGDDGEEFGDATRAELMCSTPTRRMRASASFPTPPPTSPPPPEPQTPCRHQAASRLNVGVQASLPDPENQQLQEELESLQLEIAKLTAKLESYSSLTSRLSAQIAPFSTHDTPEESPPSHSHSDLEAHLTIILQTLSDRTAALSELNTSLTTLGFPGADAFEVIDTLRSTLRAARLELEYLTPGEITLPLTGAGAAVLDLLLTQLRALAAKNRAADDCIDEYHALELSLRQQLTARVDAMDAVGDKLSIAEREGREKVARVAELEVGLDRLKGAVRSYARDVAELETLVERLEGELAAADAGRVEQQQGAATAELEGKLAAALGDLDKLRAELAALSATHAEVLAAHKTELSEVTRAHGAVLAQRDARAAQLRVEVDRLNTSLREAQEAVQKLRVENARLQGEKGEAWRLVDEERRKAKEVVDGMRAELERVAKMSEGFLGAAAHRLVGGGQNGEGVTPAKSGAGPGTSAGGLLAGGLARSGRGRKRRRYDSGLGLLDEEEMEGDA